MPLPLLRIALLHLAPRPGELRHNRRLLAAAIRTAAGLGAAGVLTPELCVCGYDFVDRLGTAWIVPPPDAWMAPLPLRGQRAPSLTGALPCADSRRNCG